MTDFVADLMHFMNYNVGSEKQINPNKYLAKEDLEMDFNTKASKVLNSKAFRISLMVCMLMVAMFSVAGAVDFEEVSKPVTDLINKLLTPVLAVVGAGGTIFCVSLGVKYAKAEEPQEREKAKTHLKNAIIGFVLIFVLIVALKVLMPQLTEWMQGEGKDTTSTPTPTKKAK